MRSSTLLFAALADARRTFDDSDPLLSRGGRRSGDVSSRQNPAIRCRQIAGHGPRWRADADVGRRGAVEYRADRNRQPHARRSSHSPPCRLAEAGKRVQAELPGFQVLSTAHYVICYGTSRVYRPMGRGAVRTALQRVFDLLDQPRRQAARSGIAAGRAGVSGSGIVCPACQGRNRRGHEIDHRLLQLAQQPRDDVRPDGRRSGAPAWRQPQFDGRDQSIANRPEAEAMVATIIHEATHQLAFNRGLQARYADVPLWVSEGIALYFETPDLRNSRGWQTVGAVNRVRLDRFRQYLNDRPTKSLESLMVNDHRFRDPRQAIDAYAEAWALTYFLIRQKPKAIHRIHRSDGGQESVVHGHAGAAPGRIQAGLRQRSDSSSTRIF